MFKLLNSTCDFERGQLKTQCQLVVGEGNN